MSAYYAMAYANRIELVTDGAIYDDEGIVLELREKVWRSDRLPLAFAGRGDENAVTLLAETLRILSSIGTVDETLARFVAALQRNEKTGAIPMDGVIAGISDSGQPKLYWFTTYHGFEGFEPFKLYDVGDQWGGGPTPSVEALAASGFPARMETESLAEAGADLIEVMRQTKMAHIARAGRPLIYGVGGHVDLTVIDSNGARTSRLRTWPGDVPGKKIEPSAACLRSSDRAAVLEAVN